MTDYYEKVCSKCVHKDTCPDMEKDSICGKCIDHYFKDWRNPKRKFGKNFRKAKNGNRISK